MLENDEALASLLYTHWSDDMDGFWSSVDADIRLRWIRLARYFKNHEIKLVAEVSEDACRKRVTERMLHRLMGV